MQKASVSKNKKWHDKKILWLAIAIASVLVISVGLILAAPRQTAAPPAQQQTTKPKDTTTQPQTQGSSNSSSATTKPQTPPAAQPATLPNCQYEGGLPSGRQCPAAPPASYSTTAKCYSQSTTPITCPDWSEMRRITGTTIDGVAYCDFTYWGGGTSETYYRSKRVKVTSSSSPNGYIDCSVERALE